MVRKKSLQILLLVVAFVMSLSLSLVLTTGGNTAKAESEQTWMEPYTFNIAQEGYWTSYGNPPYVTFDKEANSVFVPKSTMNGSDGYLAFGTTAFGSYKTEFELTTVAASGSPNIILVAKKNTKQVTTIGSKTGDGTRFAKGIDGYQFNINPYNITLYRGGYPNNRSLKVYGFGSAPAAVKGEIEPGTPGTGFLDEVVRKYELTVLISEDLLDIKIMLSINGVLAINYDSSVDTVDIYPDPLKTTPFNAQNQNDYNYVVTGAQLTEVTYKEGVTPISMAYGYLQIIPQLVDVTMKATPIDYDANPEGSHPAWNLDPLKPSNDTFESLNVADYNDMLPFHTDYATVEDKKVTLYSSANWSNYTSAKKYDNYRVRFVLNLSTEDQITSGNFRIGIRTLNLDRAAHTGYLLLVYNNSLQLHKNPWASPMLKYQGISYNLYDGKDHLFEIEVYNRTDDSAVVVNVGIDGASVFSYADANEPILQQGTFSIFANKGSATLTSIKDPAPYNVQDFNYVNWQDENKPSINTLNISDPADMYLEASEGFITVDETDNKKIILQAQPQIWFTAPSVESSSSVQTAFMLNVPVEGGIADGNVRFFINANGLNDMSFTGYQILVYSNNIQLHKCPAPGQSELKVFLTTKFNLYDGQDHKVEIQAYANSDNSEYRINVAIDGYSHITYVDSSSPITTPGQFVLAAGNAGTATITSLYDISTPYIVDIEPDMATVKTEYRLNETIDFTGMKLKLLYNTREVELIDIIDEMVSEFSTASLAQNIEVTITYNDGENEFTCTYEVSVEDYATGISVTDNKSGAYKHGEALDITVTYVMASGAAGSAVTDYTTDYNAQTLGEQTVTVTAGEFTKTITVTVSDHVTGIAVTDNKSGAYKYGEALDITVSYVMASGAAGSAVTNYTTDYDDETLGQQTVTVTAGEFTKTITVTVSDYATGIAVTDNKSGAYKYGETLDVTVTYVMASGAAGSAVTNYTTDYNAEILGEQTVTVTAGEFTKTITVTVSDYATGITVTDNESGAYRYGEELDITVTYVMASGAAGSAVTNYTTDYDDETLGEQTITVTLGEFTETFTVTVTDYVVDITVIDNKSGTYNYGQDLDISVKQVMASGAVGEEITDYTTNFNKNSEGEQTVTVTYGEFTKDITVTVGPTPKGCKTAIDITFIAAILALAALMLLIRQRKNI